jgi:hypothetical protein
MSHTRLDNIAVISGTVTMPRLGVWQADLVLDASEAPTGRVTLAVGAKLSISGVVQSSGVFAGAVRVRVVGGAGGLGRELTPRWYVGAPLRLPLLDVLEEAGERLSPASDDATLSAVLDPTWGRTQGSAAAALGNLVEVAGASWRVLSDGSVWVGPETWPEAAAMADLVTLEDHGADGRLVVVSEAPTVLPGQTLGGRRVSYVQHTIAPDKIRSELWLDRAGASGPLDRFKAAITAIVHAILGRRLDYLAPVLCKVVAIDGAGRLEVKPDDARRPPMTRVPTRTLPGLSWTPKAGGKVLVCFEGGDPRKPYASLWETGDIDALTLGAASKVELNSPELQVNGGQSPVAYQGAMVQVFHPALIPNGFAYGIILNGRLTMKV